MENEYNNNFIEESTEESTEELKENETDESTEESTEESMEITVPVYVSNKDGYYEYLNDIGLESVLLLFIVFLLGFLIVIKD